MGLSWRKSINLGLIRLNLATGGVGISFGIRGARVSIGPRGVYVNLTRWGFRYSKKIGNPPSFPGLERGEKR